MDNEIIPMESITILILACGSMFIILALILFLSHNYTLNGIKNKTVGDGQYGTARFATVAEVRKTYKKVEFNVEAWRQGIDLPDIQGLIVGCQKKHGKMSALIDDDDIHALMIGAAGVGKTAFFLYPNLEYA